MLFPDEQLSPLLRDLHWFGFIFKVAAYDVRDRRIRLRPAKQHNKQLPEVTHNPLIRLWPTFSYCSSLEFAAGYLEDVKSEVNYAKAFLAYSIDAQSRRAFFTSIGGGSLIRAFL